MYLSGASPARRRLYLACLVALVAVIAATATAVLASRRSGKTAVVGVSRTAPGPVLLVPGYGGSTTSLQLLAARLRAAGRSVVVVTVPGGGTGDLTTQAQALDTAARRAMAADHAESVDVVGYSAGGVVARLWVAHHGGAGVARRIVTLGSPQHGTEVADLAASLDPSQCPEACRQLTTTSSLLSGLNSGAETPSGPSFVSIWTTHDDVVLPPDSARLAGAALNITVQQVCAGDTVRHSGLPKDPTVIGMVQAELGAAAPTGLSTADCARLST